MYGSAQGIFHGSARELFDNDAREIFNNDAREMFNNDAREIFNNYKIWCTRNNYLSYHGTFLCVSQRGLIKEKSQDPRKAY